jgi:hypothetical protein
LEDHLEVIRIAECCRWLDLESTSWSALKLPKKVMSAQVFESSIAAIRQSLTETRGNERRFLDSMYYLLGWMVGDAGKGFNRARTKARLALDLSRRHPENLTLGNFVVGCISMLGPRCGRIADSGPRKRDRFGLYRWMTSFSEVFAWLHTACLGLQPEELTSYDSVKMTWLLTAPRESKIWFLRGVADSDGAVNVRNRSVDIVTEPNSHLIATLFKSVGVRPTTWTSKGVGVVSIGAVTAWSLRIFNPKVETHRGRMLRRLANAQTFPARWPGWLQSKVSKLASDGARVVQIRDILLWEDNTYVKLKTLKNKTK